MYIVLYAFNVKPNKKDDFFIGWKGLTELIFKYKGSLGSRLHKNDIGNYIAYAQWPDKTTFDTSGDNLPKEAKHFRHLMRTSCKTIEILQKMEVQENFLREKQSE